MTATEKARAALLARAYEHSWPEITVWDVTVDSEEGWRSATKDADMMELQAWDDELTELLIGVKA